MIMKRCLIIAIFIFSVFNSLNVVLAATVNGDLTTGNKGTASFNSQGSIDIDVTKGDAVQISNLNTIVMSNQNGFFFGIFKTASDDVCYYATTVQYSVDMNTDNNFKLINTVNPSKTMAYQLRWDDGKNGSYEKTFNANNNVAYVSASNNKTSATCQATGGTNATIQVLVLDLTFNTQVAGLYVDTVHITLKAQ
jgi:hypothetical protein